MSKITDALQRAAQERVTRLAAQAPANGFFGALKQELREEFGWSRGAPKPNGAPLEHQVAAGSGATPPTPAATSAGMKPAEPHSTSPEAVEHAIEVVMRQLEASSEDVAKRAAEECELRAQLAAAEQLAGHVEAQRRTLSQRLEDARQRAQALEQAKAAWQRQLEALRECQRLSHGIRVVQDEARANNVMLAQMTQFQQRVAEDAAHYQQRGEALRERIEQLRQRLQRTLALTGTVDPEQTQ